MSATLLLSAFLDLTAMIEQVFVKEREQKTMKQLEAYHDDDVV